MRPCADISLTAQLCLLQCNLLQLLNVLKHKQSRVHEGQEEEDALARSDDPVALWLDDWAIDAPWEKYASHADPVGGCKLATRACSITLVLS